VREDAACKSLPGFHGLRETKSCGGFVAFGTPGLGEIPFRAPLTPCHNTI
jgi:hypothetical protein